MNNTTHRGTTAREEACARSIPDLSPARPGQRAPVAMVPRAGDYLITHGFDLYDMATQQEE